MGVSSSTPRKVRASSGPIYISHAHSWRELNAGKTPARLLHELLTSQGLPVTPIKRQSAGLHMLALQREVQEARCVVAVVKDEFLDEVIRASNQEKLGLEPMSWCFAELRWAVDWEKPVVVVLWPGTRTITEDLLDSFSPNIRPAFRDCTPLTWIPQGEESLMFGKRLVETLGGDYIGIVPAAHHLKAAGLHRLVHTALQELQLFSTDDLLGACSEDFEDAGMPLTAAEAASLAKLRQKAQDCDDQVMYTLLEQSGKSIRERPEPPPAATESEPESLALSPRMKAALEVKKSRLSHRNCTDDARGNDSDDDDGAGHPPMAGNWAGNADDVMLSSTMRSRQALLRGSEDFITEKSGVAVCQESLDKGSSVLGLNSLRRLITSRQGSGEVSGRPYSGGSSEYHSAQSSPFVANQLASPRRQPSSFTSGGTPTPTHRLAYMGSPRDLRSTLERRASDSVSVEICNISRARSSVKAEILVVEGDGGQSVAPFSAHADIESPYGTPSSGNARSSSGDIVFLSSTAEEEWANSLREPEPPQGQPSALDTVPGDTPPPPPLQETVSIPTRPQSPSVRESFGRVAGMLQRAMTDKLPFMGSGAKDSVLPLASPDRNSAEAEPIKIPQGSDPSLDNVWTVRSPSRQSASPSRLSFADTPTATSTPPALTPKHDLSGPVAALNRRYLDVMASSVQAGPAAASPPPWYSVLPEEKAQAVPTQAAAAPGLAAGSSGRRGRQRHGSSEVVLDGNSGEQLSRPEASETSGSGQARPDQGGWASRSSSKNSKAFAALQSFYAEGTGALYQETGESSASHAASSAAAEQTGDTISRQGSETSPHLAPVVLEDLELNDEEPAVLTRMQSHSDKERLTPTPLAQPSPPRDRNKTPSPEKRPPAEEQSRPPSRGLFNQPSHMGMALLEEAGADLQAERLPEDDVLPETTATRLDTLGPVMHLDLSIESGIIDGESEVFMSREPSLTSQKSRLIRRRSSSHSGPQATSPAATALVAAGLTEMVHALCHGLGVCTTAELCQMNEHHLEQIGASAKQRASLAKMLQDLEKSLTAEPAAAIGTDLSRALAAYHLTEIEHALRQQHIGSIDSLVTADNEQLEVALRQVEDPHLHGVQSFRWRRLQQLIAIAKDQAVEEIAAEPFDTSGAEVDGMPLGPLINALENHREGQEAVLKLQAISGSPSCRFYLAVGGALGPLIAHAQQLGNKASATAAAAVVRAVLQDRECLSTASAMEAVPEVLAAALKLAEASASDTQQNAAASAEMLLGAFVDLLKGPRSGEVAECIRPEAVIPPLCSILRRSSSTSTPLSRSALAILLVVAKSDEASRVMLADSPGMLVALAESVPASLRRPARGDKEAINRRQSDADGAAASLHLLGMLVEPGCPESRYRQVLDAGVLSKSLALLDTLEPSGPGQVQASAACLVRNLAAGSQQLKDEVAESGAIPRMVRLLSDKESREAASVALSDLEDHVKSYYNLETRQGGRKSEDGKPKRMGSMKTKPGSFGNGRRFSKT